MKNKHYDSEGNDYTQSQINRKYNQEKKGWLVKYICECCGVNQTNDPDHTISRTRSKTLHKTELIWAEGNISWSCRECHQQWESYKDGKFSHHSNAYKRMVFTAMYDKEGFIKRYHCIINKDLQKKLTSLYLELTEI